MRITEHPVLAGPFWSRRPSGAGTTTLKAQPLSLEADEKPAIATFGRT